MKNILLINGHPHVGQSFANRIIVEEVKGLLPEIRVRTLADLYPDGRFDVEAEQKALAEADVVVWQFPFYWYSVPGLLKTYLEDVFTHGFAYGTEGTALQGKKLLMSFTIGAPGEVYGRGKPMSYGIEEFLFPVVQTAAFCRMEWVPPVYSSGMMYMEGVSPEEDRICVTEAAKDHARRLAELLKSL